MGFGVFCAIALVVLGFAHGQAVKDPALPNPVRISTRLQVLATIELQSVRLGEPMLTPLGSVLRTHRSISSEGPTRLEPGSESDEAVWDLGKL
jgi:hypothetical protein